MRNMTLKQNKSSVSPVTAAVTGAIVGAGAAVVGIAAMRDEKTRAKAKKILHQAKVTVKKQARGYINQLDKKAHDLQMEAESKADQGQREIKSMTKSATKKYKN